MDRRSRSSVMATLKLVADHERRPDGAVGPVAPVTPTVTTSLLGRDDHRHWSPPRPSGLPCASATWTRISSGCRTRPPWARGGGPVRVRRPGGDDAGERRARHRLARRRARRPGRCPTSRRVVRRDSCRRRDRRPSRCRPRWRPTPSPRSGRRPRPPGCRTRPGARSHLGRRLTGRPVRHRHRRRARRCAGPGVTVTVAEPERDAAGGGRNDVSARGGRAEPCRSSCRRRRSRPAGSGVTPAPVADSDDRLAGESDCCGCRGRRP